MVVRLAFAVAIHVDPEILLVDEALAVGDVYFRQRCMRKVHELRARGVTILFVSHATGDVKALGDRAMWLDHGQVMAHRQDGSRGIAVSCSDDREGRTLSGAATLNCIRQHLYQAPEEIVEAHPEHRSSLRRWQSGDPGHRRSRRGGCEHSFAPARFYNCS